MTVLLASGNTTTTSADFTVAANTSFVMSIFTAPGVYISNSDAAALDLKTDNGNYTQVDTLTTNKLVGVLPQSASAITYRLRRVAGNVAFGVDGR